MVSNKLKLYYELAWIWPMWGDPETEYAEYCNFIISKIRSVANREMKTLLNIGCGGGKNIYTLKRYFITVGLDLSPEMLKHASELNPECEFVCADMRTFDLNSKFDVVFIDDAITYMTTRADLQQVFKRAFAHLEPGGIMVVTPDVTLESFIQNYTQVFHSLKSDKYPQTEIVYITTDYSSNAESEKYETSFIYQIRTNGKLKIETEVHEFGLFSLQVWIDLLKNAGYVIQQESYKEGEHQYSPFICVKPK